MNRFFITILVLAALLFPLTAAAAGNVPTAAVSIAKQLDEQIMMRFSGDSQDMSRKDREALARLHDNYLHCGIRNRDDLGQMRKYDPEFTGKQPRF